MGCGPRCGGPTPFKRSFDTPQKKMKKSLARFWGMGSNTHASQEASSINKYMSNYSNQPGAYASVTNEDLAQAGVRTSARHIDDEDINDDLLQALRGAVGYADMEGGFCTPPAWYTFAQNAIERAERISENANQGDYDVEDIQDRNPMRGCWGKGEY